MIHKPSTIISGALAFGIYFAVVTLLLFYFNSRDEKKPLHFVKKNEERIRVSMSTPTPKQESKKEKKKVVKTKPKPKPKPKPKKTVQKKETKKKVIKEKVVKKAKVVKKKKDVNTTKPKKVNKPKDLFANISSKKKVEKPKKPAVAEKPKKSDPDKPSAALLFDSLKTQKQSDKGIENAYLAKIEEKLKGWPAQSDYAGERAKVWIQVEPSGSFEFKVITASGNEAFNAGLIAYLKQLQSIGFDKHKGNRAYKLDVEFVATD